MRAHLALILAALLLAPAGAALAQDEPLRIEITEGTMAPMPIALRIEAEGEAVALAAEITGVIEADLTGTGLFTLAEIRDLPDTRFDRAVDYVGWKATDTEALVTGSVSAEGDKIVVRFRLFDIFAGQPLGDGMQLDAPRAGWRRAAHKIADQIYAQITGEAPYFDSRIAFIGESGPATARIKRVGVMDADGADVKWLTAGGELALSPRFSPDGRTVLYTSFASGMPQIMAMDGGIGAGAAAHFGPARHELRAALFARWPMDRLFARNRRQYRYLDHAGRKSALFQAVDARPLDRHGTVMVARWPPDRLRKRPFRQFAALHHARRWQRSGADLVRRGRRLWRTGMVAARRPHRLHPAWPAGLCHRDHAPRRLGRAAPDRGAGRCRAKLGAEWPCAHLHTPAG